MTFDGIAKRIPHRGSMCLLSTLEMWDLENIHCTAVSHRDPKNPLRTTVGLMAACAIEYAAQAMALHGAVLAEHLQRETSEKFKPTPGFIASVRNVQSFVSQLDGVSGALQVRATRLSGDAQQVMYGFAVNRENGAPLVTGRAIVVLNTPLPVFEDKQIL